MKLLESVDIISCRTDTPHWSTAQCTDSILSVTAQWLDNNLVRRSALLAASHMYVAHTVENIKTVVTGTDTFVCDNAKIMTNGLCSANYFVRGEQSKST